MFKRSKYGNKKTELDGLKFDSKIESKRYLQLRSMLEDGHITELQMQVKYKLIGSQLKEDGKKERPLAYIADFVYKVNGKTIVEDVKGMRTGEYIQKRKLMLFIHGITIKEIDKV